MSIVVEWNDMEKAAVRIIFESPWTWDEFKTAGQAIVGLVREVDHKICLIL